jgi:hypothetical protein
MTAWFFVTATTLLGGGRRCQAGLLLTLATKSHAFVSHVTLVVLITRGLLGLETCFL